jgi:hypothetical protein
MSGIDSPAADLARIARTISSDSFEDPLDSHLRDDCSGRRSPVRIACCMFCFGVTYSRFDGALFSLSPSMWLTWYPSGHGPMNASATRRCTHLLNVLERRLMPARRYPFTSMCGDSTWPARAPLLARDLRISPRSDTSYAPPSTGIHALIRRTSSQESAAPRSARTDSTRGSLPIAQTRRIAVARLQRQLFRHASAASSPSAAGSRPPRPPARWRRRERRLRACSDRTASIRRIGLVVRLPRVRDTHERHPRRRAARFNPNPKMARLPDAGRACSPPTNRADSLLLVAGLERAVHRDAVFAECGLRQRVLLRRSNHTTRSTARWALRQRLRPRMPRRARPGQTTLRAVRRSDSVFASTANRLSAHAYRMASWSAAIMMRRRRRA